MPDARETRRMLKPLLMKRPDLLLLKRDLLVVPIRSVMRGIFFERCSSPGVYLPYVCIAPLACAGSEPGASIGSYFVRPEKLPREEAAERYGPDAATETMSRLWSVDDPDYPDAMISAVEKQCSRHRRA